MARFDLMAQDGTHNSCGPVVAVTQIPEHLPKDRRIAFDAQRVLSLRQDRIVEATTEEHNVVKLSSRKI